MPLSLGDYRLCNEVRRTARGVAAIWDIAPFLLPIKPCTPCFLRFATNTRKEIAIHIEYLLLNTIYSFLRSAISHVSYELSFDFYSATINASLICPILFRKPSTFGSSRNMETTSMMQLIGASMLFSRKKSDHEVGTTQ